MELSKKDNQSMGITAEVAPDEASPPTRPPTASTCRCPVAYHEFFSEMWDSTDILFHSKLTWLLMLGPVALLGDATGIFGEALCFTFSGIALIPCAERLSFVTEQVASHTNGTIGALLNATFGNAPELLISTAALRAGFYRVVQLAMLGSMLTNLLFVFGISCLVGGLRWQVQELRITSGNVSVGMLLLATAGSLLPAALVMSGEMRPDDPRDRGEESSSAAADGAPSDTELTFCRVNALVMMMMYLAYLVFQLGTHKEEFDNEENVVETPDHVMLLTPHFTALHGHKNRRAERNLFCLKFLLGNDKNRRHGEDRRLHSKSSAAEDLSDEEFASDGIHLTKYSSSEDEEQQLIASATTATATAIETSSISSAASLGSEHLHMPRVGSGNLGDFNGNASWESRGPGVAKRRAGRARGGSAGSPSYTMMNGSGHESDSQHTQDRREGLVRVKSHRSDHETSGLGAGRKNREEDDDHHRVMSFRTGLLWLFIITLCISAMSDILVDSIDGFAYRCNLSEVFTSMVIVPFFSNVAEQVSAIIFAYRNKMDLCVGVTVGSAIQIASFVLPGCVLIGMFVDRSMSLYFRGYETCCLFLAVITVAAVLQGGTTNWLVGMTLIGIYTMIAAGFWFHQVEDLSIDAELLFQNATRRHHD